MISLIIPVYNRPGEVKELLDSLAEQTCRRFEVVIVEDGSSVDCRDIAERYSGELDISYYYQSNGGPASARNTGASNAKGDFLVIMDSDCIVPPEYFERVDKHLQNPEIKFYGGADSAAEDFSPLQKAVSYSMTSLFTTGGIRGNRKSLGKFIPRSFNLGIDKELYWSVGGFSDMRIGEDIDFGKKVIAAGAKAWFLPDLTVYHKRRTTLRLFFKQVFIFGVARVNIDIRHPGSRKPVFYIPLIFTLGSLALVACACVLSPWLLVPFALLMLLWFIDASVRNRSARIGWLAVWTSFIQLYGYGAGFMYGIWMRYIRGKTEKDTYKVTKFFSQKTR